MSQENVEIVRAAIESFNRGDLDTLLREMHPEIEWHDQPELPGSTIHRGADAAVEHLRSVQRDLPGYHMHPKELLDTGAKVVVCGRISAHGRVSEVPVDRSVFVVYEIQAGRILRVRIFGTRDEALEAAGLRE